MADQSSRWRLSHTHLKKTQEVGKQKSKTEPSDRSCRAENGASLKMTTAREGSRKHWSYSTTLLCLLIKCILTREVFNYLTG